MNDSKEHVKKHCALIRVPALLMLSVGLVAWCSNPDEGSFERWMARRLEATGDPLVGSVSNLDAARLVVAAGDIERVNFGFFSLVRMDGQTSGTFAGALGHWVPLWHTKESELVGDDTTSARVSPGQKRVIKRAGHA